MNYYDELEVSTKASTEVIKAAYKAQAKKYHPDIYRGDPRFASEKLVNLNSAYDILTNSQKREEYDYLNKLNINKSPTDSKTSNYNKNSSKQTNNKQKTGRIIYPENTTNKIILSIVYIGIIMFLIVFIYALSI